MREIKKQINKIHKQILEEDTFFEEVLLPKFNEEKIKSSYRRKRKKRTALISSALLAIAATVGIVIGIILKPNIPYNADTNYLDQIETKASDIATINQSLNNIQITGEFDSVTVTYYVETLKNNYFTANKEIMTEDSLVTFRMVLVVDRNYPYKTEETEYSDNFDFLDYMVEFNEEIIDSKYEDIQINEFTINAFFDTGQELIYITYNEISCNDFNGFQKMLNELIINK